MEIIINTSLEPRKFTYLKSIKVNACLDDWGWFGEILKFLGIKDLN